MEIVIALISGLCVAIPSILATWSSNKKTTALITYRLDILEKKVNEHNNWALRIQHLEDEVKFLTDSRKWLYEKSKNCWWIRKKI